MPWPSEITRAFATVGGLADIVIRGKDYHGPYNKLLSTLFPPDSDFIVSPTYIPHDIDPDADPKLFSFEVMLHEHPVLVLEIKPPQHLSFDSTRGTADMEIRRHLVDCSSVCRHLACALIMLPPISFFRACAPPYPLRHQCDGDKTLFL